MTGILAIENLKANDHNLWGVNTERCAPCKAWRFLSGESPIIINPNQK
jgi:hypothetical protein